MSEGARISSGRRILELDGLRGLAVLLILVEHDYLMIPIISDWHGHKPLKSLLAGTATGVELFFVLSGFLIASILMENRLATNLRRVFYTRRISRTAPVYALLLGSFFAVRASGLMPMPETQYVFRESLPIWSYFFMVQNVFMAAIRDIGPFWLGITWSLAVEEQFYLLMPWLVTFLRLPILLTLAGASLVICPLLRWFAELNGNLLVIYLLPARMENLFLGVVLAVIWHRPAWLEWFAAKRTYLGIFLLCFIPFFFLLPHLLPWAFILTLYGCAYFVLVLYILISPDANLCRLLRSRLLVFMGGISYFVYLFHFPFLYFFHGVFRRDLPFHADTLGRVCTWASLATLLMVAVCSRRWIELPFINLGRRQRYEFDATVAGDGRVKEA